MAKLKAGTVNTAGPEQITLHIENASTAGDFMVIMGAAHLHPEQARRLGQLLTEAADKADILEAACGG